MVKKKFEGVRELNVNFWDYFYKGNFNFIYLVSCGFVFYIILCFIGNFIFF